MRRSVRVSVLWLALGSAGCERGCLREKVDEALDRKHGIAAPLAAVDCPDGLARCVDGVVETSRAYGYSVPCAASPEKCTCPWDRVTTCSRGCAAELAVLPIVASAAAEQLCAPGSSVAVPAAPPLLAPTVNPLTAGGPATDAAVPWSEPTASASCEGERYRCTRGSVVACEPASHPIARCLFGCAVEDATIEEPSVTDGAATSFLCLHGGKAN